MTREQEVEQLALGYVRDTVLTFEELISECALAMRRSCIKLGTTLDEEIRAIARKGRERT